MGEFGKLTVIKLTLVSLLFVTGILSIVALSTDHWYSLGPYHGGFWKWCIKDRYIERCSSFAYTTSIPDEGVWNWRGGWLFKRACVDLRNTNYKNCKLTFQSSWPGIHSFKIFQHTSHNVCIFVRRFARMFLRLHQLQKDVKTVTGRLCDKCIVDQHTPIGLCCSHLTILRHAVKSGVIDCLVQRATIVSSNDELSEKELDKIREAIYGARQLSEAVCWKDHGHWERSETKKDATSERTGVRPWRSHC